MANVESDVNPKHYLQKRLLALHESSYLSLMSIVQGVALGAFIISVKESSFDFGYIGWSLLVTTFFLIVLTWNEYIIGVAIFKWTPNLLDSTIPFLFCIAEVWLAFHIDDNPRMWLFGFAAFSGIACLAYINMYSRARRHCENIYILGKLSKHHICVKIITFLAAILALLFAVISQCLPEWFPPAIILFLLAIFIIRTTHYYNLIIGIADFKSTRSKQND